MLTPETQWVLFLQEITLIVRKFDYKNITTIRCKMYKVAFKKAMLLVFAIVCYREFYFKGADWWIKNYNRKTSL